MINEIIYINLRNQILNLIKINKNNSLIQEKMTSNEALDAYLAAKPRWEATYLVRKLMEHLQIPYHRINNFRKKRRPIEHVYRVEISKFLGEDIFKDVTD